MITANNLLLPDELERRQIFHLLKKHSSWTAWNRMLGYYQKFADITEESVRQSDEGGLLPKKKIPPGTISMSRTPETEDYFGQTSIVYRDFVKVLQGLALFDEGVRRLGTGDKRVFTADEAHSLLFRGADHTSHYSMAKHKIDDDEIAWQETTPLMKEFFEALGDFGKTYGECAPHILESDDPDQIANEVALNSYGLREMVFLSQLPYPNPLPELPEISEIVEIKTGEEIPCFGIWQPVKNGQPICAMNYLHAGSLARQAYQRFRDTTARNGYDGYAEDVTWRLLWRDDRYEDGTIPAEEQDYQFVEPSPKEVVGYHNVGYVGGFLRRHGLPNPLLDNEHPLIRVEGGQPCPQDGQWWTPASREGQGYFKKGALMPNYPGSKYGATIWYRLEK